MYQIVTWHGENKTIYYLVRNNGLEWEICESFDSLDKALLAMSNLRGGKQCLTIICPENGVTYH